MLNIHRSIAFAIITILLFGTVANAQGASVATSDPSQQVLQVAQRFENNLMALAKAMPDDKYNFAPNGEVFKSGSSAKFETVRTFAQQLTHVSDMSFRYYEAFGFKPDTDINPKNLVNITSKDEVLKVLKAAFDVQNKAIASLTPENAFKPQGPRNVSLISAILAVLNDAGDHYGQLVEYGRMNGIVPPATENQLHTAAPAAPQK